MQIFLLVAVFLINYFRVPFLFFQQDEILGFGRFIEHGRNIIFQGVSSGRIEHFVPLTMSLSYFIYVIFGMNYWVYNVLGLIFHLVNGVLVYRLAKIMAKRQASAFVAALLFFSSSVAAQLVMWPVINLNTLSLTFALLAWLALLKQKFLWLPILFLLSVFSVEYSAGLALFVPSAMFLTIKEGLKGKIVKIIPFGLTVLAYSFFRFWPILSQQAQAFGASTGSQTTIPYAIFSLITRYIGQLFFGQGILLFLARTFQRLLGLTSLGTGYAETGIFPVVSMVAGFLLTVGTIIFYRRVKRDKPRALNLLIVSSFIIFSSLPFLLVPGGLGFSSVIASRYLYFGLAGSAIFLMLLYEQIILGAKKARGFVYLAVAAFVAIGTYENFVQSKRLYEQGTLRINILRTIKDSYPVLPKKVIFLAESDTSYYGLPPEDKILPFQSGLGQTLLMFYYENEKFPMEFYPGSYLWEIRAQGYKEVGNRGFGFFRDRQLLKKTIEDYNIPSSSVIAFSWYGQVGELRDITDEIRKQLR